MQTASADVLPLLGWVGAAPFDRTRIKPVANSANAEVADKPAGGLWLSPLLGTEGHPLFPGDVGRPATGDLRTAWVGHPSAPSPAVVTVVALRPAARLLVLDAVDSYDRAHERYGRPDHGPLAELIAATGDAGMAPSAQSLFDFRMLDWEAIARDHDAVWVRWRAIGRGGHRLGTWDVETVLVLRRDVVAH